MAPAAGNKISSTVAVITRTKDRPLLLPRAIDSVLKQTFTKWLHIIINDGGDPDAIDSLMEPYKFAYAGRVLIIHNPDSMGMEAASNIGIASCESEFIAIHDDDDTWHPDFLKRSVEVLAATTWPDVGGVVTRTIRIVEQIKDNKVQEIRREPFNDKMVAIEIPQLCAANPFPPISFIFRRTLYDKVGGFDANLERIGDWDFNLRAVLEAEIIVIPESLAYYHHRPADMSIYGNTVIAGLDRNRMFRSLVINKFIRAEYKSGRIGLGMLVSLGAQNEGLSRLARAANIFLDRTAKIVRGTKILSFLH